MDCYRYSCDSQTFAKEPSPLQQKISAWLVQLYRIIVNQIHREEAYFLSRTL